MNHTFFRRSAAALLAALLCGSALVMNGCAGNSGSSGDEPAPELSLYEPEVPESRIDESIPGDKLSAKIGETVEYADKLTVTLNQVVEIDDVAKTEYRVLMVEITVANHSDSKIDCQTLTHFSALIDGEVDSNAIRDVRAAIAGRQYYTKINSSLESFNQEIPAGETLTGYVYLGMPSAWETLQLVYTPYRYYSNDQIVFDIDEDAFVHYSQPLK